MSIFTSTFEAIRACDLHPRAAGAQLCFLANTKTTPVIDNGQPILTVTEQQPVYEH